MAKRLSKAAVHKQEMARLRGIRQIHKDWYESQIKGLGKYITVTVLVLSALYMLTIAIGTYWPIIQAIFL